MVFSICPIHEISMTVSKHTLYISIGLLVRVSGKLHTKYIDFSAIGSGCNAEIWFSCIQIIKSESFVSSHIVTDYLLFQLFTLIVHCLPFLLFYFFDISLSNLLFLNRHPNIDSDSIRCHDLLYRLYCYKKTIAQSTIYTLNIELSLVQSSILE